MIRALRSLKTPQRSLIFNKVETKDLGEVEDVEELPDSWWFQVYIGVIVSNILVIAALGLFTRYFSS